MMDVNISRKKMCSGFVADIKDCEHLPLNMCVYLSIVFDSFAKNVGLIWLSMLKKIDFVIFGCNCVEKIE